MSKCWGGQVIELSQLGFNKVGGGMDEAMTACESIFASAPILVGALLTKVFLSMGSLSSMSQYDSKGLLASLLECNSSSKGSLT